MVGVYDHPPPEGSGLDSYYYDPESMAAGLFDRELVRVAGLITRLRDRLPELPR